MANDSIVYSKHKEYSLILAVAVAVLLLAVGNTQSLFLLLILNVTAIASILFSAFSVVRHADVLAHRFGEPFGSLILSLAIVILEVSLISILMLSGGAGETLMRDTIYSVIIIVLAGLVGFALLMGGRKYRSQYFNFSGIKHYLISIISLSFIVLVLPSVLENNTFTPAKLVVVALCCILMYVVFLIMQTKTHRNFFVYENEDDDAEDPHGKPSRYSTVWHGAFLVIHLIAVIGVTKLNSYALSEFLFKLNAPVGFTGFLVAFLILTPEGLGAFDSILKNQVQRAMNLLLGSVLATISLTVPAVVLVAAIKGQTLVLGLDISNTIIMLCTFMVCSLSLTGGKINAHSGAAHLVLFVAYIMLLF